jgi:hypothetical protein
LDARIATRGPPPRACRARCAHSRCSSPTPSLTLFVADALTHHHGRIM